MKTSQDSINVFYSELFKSLKSGYLFKDRINWKKIESETYQRIGNAKDFESSLKEIIVLFEKIDASHSKVFYKDKEYAIAVRFAKENLSEQWLKKYADKPEFEAKVIDDKFGYVLIPKMLFDDVSSKNIHKIAQPMYNKIVDLKMNNKIDGWIIDLRFNTGGNAWPMLLALYDLLGNNSIWGILDVDKKLVNTTRLEKGNYIDYSRKISYINPKGELLDQSKVAVITGLLTASSGEVTALSFKGRPNTIFIGENTFGKTTSNVLRDLPFGSRMAISTGYDTDRNGNYYEQIVPDIAISKQDNFDDYLSDKNIQEAIKFISKK